MRRLRRRGEVLAAIEAAGGYFEEYGGGEGLQGSAVVPAGLVWNATDCHSIAINFFSERSEGWKALGEDVAQGVRPCDDKNCDWDDCPSAT